jgi:hypothetical protein
VLLLANPKDAKHAAKHDKHSRSASLSHPSAHASSAIARAVMQVLACDVRVQHRAMAVQAERSAAVLTTGVSESVSVAALERGFPVRRLVMAQEDPVLVRGAADWLDAQIGDRNPQSLILVEGILAQAFTPAAGFDVQGEWPLLSMPGMLQAAGLQHTQAVAGGYAPVTVGAHDSVPPSACAYPYDPRVLLSGWVLRLGRLGGSAATAATEALVCVNTNDHTGYTPNFHGLGLLLRAVGTALQTRRGGMLGSGINNLLLLCGGACAGAGVAVRGGSVGLGGVDIAAGGVASLALGATSSVSGPGRLVIVKDHINFTGTNPMFGENHAHYGPRFNDMSGVYKPAAIAAFAMQASENQPIAASIALQVSSPSLGSLAEAAAARAMHAELVVSGLAPAATLAKHMDMPVAALLYVYRTAGASDDPATIQSATAAVYQRSVHTYYE